MKSLRGLADATPDQLMTRAELAFVLEDLVIGQTGNQELATKYVGSESSPFVDVKETQPTFNSIMTVSTLHLLPARDSNHFAPMDPATPAEVRSALTAFENSPGAR